MNTASFDECAPVLLSSSCVVNNNNIGIPSSVDLQYAYRKPILIDEIRFVITEPAIAQLANPIPNRNFGSLISLKMQLGQKYLMRDAVPLWLLGTVMNPNVEIASDFRLPLATLLFYYSSAYRWRLPEPLYIEPDQILSPQFSRGNDIVSDPLTVQVSYVGRTVPSSHPRPKQIPIPYAASYVTTLGTVYGQSNEIHLENPFNYDLHIQRLTARALNISNATSNITSVLATTPAPSYNGALQMQVQVKDSWGDKICQQLTGPSDVWDIARGSWTVDSVLGANGIYEINAWNLDPTHQLHVGMIGHRMEPL